MCTWGFISFERTAEDKTKTSFSKQQNWNSSMLVNLRMLMRILVLQFHCWRLLSVNYSVIGLQCNDCFCFSFQALKDTFAWYNGWAVTGHAGAHGSAISATGIFFFSERLLKNIRSRVAFLKLTEIRKHYSLQIGKESLKRYNVILVVLKYIW